MSGRKQEINRQFNQIVDGVLLVLAFWAAHTFRIGLTELHELADIDLFKLGPIPHFDNFRWLLFIIMPFGPIFLEAQGFYTHPLQKTRKRSLNQMLHAGFWLALLIGLCVIFFRLEVPSRSVLIIFAGLATILLLIREYLSLLYAHAAVKKGRLREIVILVGTKGDVANLKAGFSRDLLLEMQIAGEVDISTEPLTRLVELLHTSSASRVIFAGAHTQMNHIQQAIEACETEGVEAWLVADFIKTSIARPTFDTLSNRPMLVFRATPELSWALMAKSLFDRVAALVLIILSIPIFIAAALAIKLSSPGPIIFIQQRSGRNGRPFNMFKFRTMTSNAEMLRAEIASLNQMEGPVFKAEHDPRITPIGRWLRKTSIDELPQLFNVLQGSMSLVGPRPLPIYEVENFQNHAQRRRLSVKPGITCLWQISGRNNVTSFDDWVKLDLDYIDNWSLTLDFKILLKTIPAVLFGSGAR